jgi:hypothetical protein
MHVEERSAQPGDKCQGESDVLAADGEKDDWRQ